MPTFPTTHLHINPILLLLLEDLAGDKSSLRHTLIILHKDSEIEVRDTYRKCGLGKGGGSSPKCSHGRHLKKLKKS